jgi:acetoin:2,6-dichlorophenolindophenol oxidoreductase subunit alpha
MTARTQEDLDQLTELDDDDLRRLLLIRHFELALLRLFEQGVLHGTTHTCLGQEYIPVAMRTLLHDNDFVLSNHRGHGHYLARYEDPEGLLAEILGREGAICGGVGGSQHVLRDRHLSTGVQGESMSVAVGIALHLRRFEPGRLACVYIGDGTWGEGAVYEALNMAALWRLPMLVLVEHNGIAQSTPTHQQLAGTIAGRAAAFGIPHQRITSADIATIRDTMAPIAAAVPISGPAVVEFVTHRVGPHSKGDDSRDETARRAAARCDWYGRYRQSFSERFAVLDEHLRTRVEKVVQDVSGRPLSHWDAR